MSSWPAYPRERPQSPQPRALLAAHNDVTTLPCLPVIATPIAPSSIREEAKRLARMRRGTHLARAISTVYWIVTAMPVALLIALRLGLRL